MITTKKKDCDYNFFYLYKNKQDILNRLEKGKPISALYFKDRLQTVFVAYSIGRYDIALMPITFDPNSLVDEASGMFFCRFFIENNKDDIIHTEKKVVCGLTRIGALMLPFKMGSDCTRFRGQFTVIYSDWDVLQQDGTKGIPKLNRALFQE